MRLNNRGFAFSTMLYGTLALIIVVLMLIFSILKSNSNETYYYSSIIEENLNKCVSEEILLENCYTSGSDQCDPTSYYACIGVNNHTSITEGKRIVDFLSEKTATSGNGLYKDEKTGNLVFRGVDVDNYIQFSGDIWRIIEVEADGAVKIAYTKYGSKLKWNVDESGEWKSSSINNELNNTFYSTLTNTSAIDKREWNIGRIYSVARTIDELVEQESLAKYGSGEAYSFVGLPNASDYVKASLNDTCSNDVLVSTNCNSWLSVYGSWLINASYTEAESIEAYYFQTGNKLERKSVTEEESVVPVIYLKSSQKIISGDGSISNPYILER